LAATLERWICSDNEEIEEKVKNDTHRVLHLARDMEAASLTAKSVMQINNHLNDVLPDIKRLLSQSQNRQNVLRQMGADFEAKLAELRQKTALARDQANRIGVGVTFYPNSTLQLRNPEGISLNQSETKNKHNKIGLNTTKQTLNYPNYPSCNRNSK